MTWMPISCRWIWSWKAASVVSIKNPYPLVIMSAVAMNCYAVMNAVCGSVKAAVTGNDGARVGHSHDANLHIAQSNSPGREVWPG